MIEFSLIYIEIFFIVKSSWWIINEIIHFLLIENFEVVCNKLVDLLYLSVRKLDCYHKVSKICMIIDYIYLMSSFF